MATPTKNSAEEAESPTRCVAETERLQMVAFPATSGTSANLESKRGNLIPKNILKTHTHTKLLRFLPERVVKVGVEGFVPAHAAEHGHDVLPAESATASEGKYSGELKQEGKMGKGVRNKGFLLEKRCSNTTQPLNSSRQEASDSAWRPCDPNALLQTNTQGILLARQAHAQLHTPAATGQSII